MELELEQEMGPDCSDLHQARCKVQGASNVPFGASSQHGDQHSGFCRGVGKACQPRALLECQPSTTSEGARGARS